MGGATGSIFQTVWCPTARPAEDDTFTKGAAIDRATRTATRCYMRGVKERNLLQVRGGASWLWRRIIFRIKGDTISLGNVDPSTSEVARQTSQGMMRLMTIDSATFDRTSNQVFRGTFGTDYTSVTNAQTNPERVTIMYDKTRTINGGNSVGKTVQVNLWHPMNKSIVYEDRESAGASNPSMFSVEGPPGMGDVYIYDIFEAGVGATSTDALYWDPQATLYWHER